MHFPVQRIGKKFKEEVGAGIFREIRDQVVYTTQACIDLESQSREGVAIYM